MGVPVGHVFFGNQYTDGGYVHGTYKYVFDKAGTVYEYSSKLVSDKIGKSANELVSRQNPKTLILKLDNTIEINKNTQILVGIIVIIAGGFIVYKHFSEKTKTIKDTQQTIELSHVGTCTQCGEPLSGSTYVPGSEADSQNAYIICNRCGEQNFAWYPNENDSSKIDFDNQLEQVLMKDLQGCEPNSENLIKGGYDMIPYWCGEGCGVDMEYIGDGDWKCPKCGKVICFGEPDEEDDDDTGETLSLWDAADIYLSKGFDEDYRFGYTHEELMKALGK